MIGALDRISLVVSRTAAQFAVAILFGVTLLILLEIVLRSFFSTSTQIVEEYVGYGLGTMVFLGLGQAMREGALVRVDLVIGKLPPGLRRAFEILACVTALVVISFVLYYLSIRIGRDFSRGTISMTRSATPMWIPQAIVAAGMLIFMFQVFVYMIGLFFHGRIIQDQIPVE